MINRKDILTATAAGVLTGLLAANLFSRLGAGKFYGFSVWHLLWLAPQCYLTGVAFGNFAARRFPFMAKFSKFVATGFTSAAVDNNVITLLVVLTGVARGPFFPFIRAGAIFVATCNSYLWNKYWSFEAAKTEKKWREFFVYFLVTLGGTLTNVGVSTLVVHLPVLWDLDAKQWANVAAVVGSAAGLFVNFTGYHKVVFRKAENKNLDDPLP